MKMGMVFITLLSVLFLAACQSHTAQRLTPVSPQSRSSEAQTVTAGGQAGQAASGTGGAGSSKFSSSANETGSAGGSGGNSEIGGNRGDSGKEGTQGTDGGSEDSGNESRTGSGGTGSSVGDTAQPDSGKTQPPAEAIDAAQALSLFQSAAQKTAALGSRSFQFLASDLQTGGSLTGTVSCQGSGASLKFVTNTVKTDTSDSEIDFYCARGILYEYHPNIPELVSMAFDPNDAEMYLFQLDPIPASGDVLSFGVVKENGGYTVTLRTGSLSAGDAIEKIFGYAGRVTAATLVETISADGYVAASDQTFTMDGGYQIRLTKTYPSPGEPVTVHSPDWMDD